jgi:hypothetical protein
MDFPLYDILIKDTTNKDLCIDKKKDFINKISKIDQNGFDMIYVLIQKYYIINNENIENSIPYKGFTEGLENNQDITWNYNNFPNKLKHILYKFVNLHIQKLENNLY